MTRHSQSSLRIPSIKMHYHWTLRTASANIAGRLTQPATKNLIYYYSTSSLSTRPEALMATFLPQNQTLIKENPCLNSKKLRNGTFSAIRCRETRLPAPEDQVSRNATWSTSKANQSDERGKRAHSRPTCLTESKHARKTSKLRDERAHRTQQR